MQKLFKRSLAVVLALMMVLTMFAGTVSAEGLAPYTSFAGINTQMFHMASLEAADLAAPNALDMQYLAQEFVPGTATISGAKVNFNLTSGSAVVHVELRKDTPTAEPFFSTEVNVTSVGDVNNHFYDLPFGQNVEVVAGDLYYLCFWFASKSSAGIVAVACGGTSEGHDLYRHKRFDSDGTKYEAETAPLKATGNAVGFEIYTNSGEVVFFDDFMPHHAADRGKWEKDTNNYTTGDFAYRAMADFRSGDKLSHSRLYRDDPVDITSLYNENGEFYLTFDFYADPEYVSSAKNYKNENNTPEENPEIKDIGIEDTRFLILLYSKGENQTATDPKSGKQAIEVTKWEPTNANANETNDWSMFGLENGLQPGWNRMALKLTDKDGVLSYGKSGQEQYWDPTKMWGISFLMRAANWADPYDQHGTVEVVFDNIKFMSVEAYEENVASIEYNYQFRNCDETGWQNTPRGEFYADTATYTEGTGAIRTALDWRSGSKLMNAWMGCIDGRQTNLDTLDVSKAIDKNGDFYITFDLWADPEYTTEAKNYDESTGEVANTLTTGLNAGRMVVGLVTRGEGQTTTAMDNATISLEVVKPAGTDWTSFGLEDGLQPGWNHIAIKANANNLKSGGEAAWDPSKLWGIKFNYDGLNWKDPKEAHGTVEIRFDDIRVMSVAAYEADFARVNAAKTAIAAIAEMDKDDDASVAAALDVYNKVPANAKYLVSNASEFDNVSLVVNESIYAVEGKNVGSGYILVPAGPQDNSPYATTPTPWTENFTEGTGAGKVQWLNTSNKTMHLSILGIDQYWDLSNAQYLTMDLYVHGFTVENAGGSDLNLGFGEANDAGSWGAQNLGWVGKAETWESGIKDLKEGWNHLVFPIPANAQKAKVGNIRLYFENSVVFNVAEGDKAYAIVDDIRVANKKGLKVIEELYAAKDVVTDIQTLEGIEDIKAARAAYEALNDTQKAYVFNLEDLEALEKDALAGDAIDQAYANLFYDATVYHNADAVDNSVVNINSGAWNVEAQDGAIKAIAKNDITKNAFCVGFRADAVKLNDYDTMTFDLFIPEGVTVPDDTYGYAYFADKHTNNQDERVWRYEIKQQALAAEKGKWVTYTVPVADQAYEGIVQITIRLAVTTAANGYVLIDNVQFNKAIDTLTFANKAGVDAVYAQYAALADTAKAYATCADELVALKADLDAKQVALDDANAKIAAIPAVDTLKLMDKFTIDAANTAYEALAEDVKPFAVGADIIAPAYAKIDELYAAASNEELAAFIGETIMSNLPSADVVSLDDAELVANVAATYEGLGAAKDLVSDEAVAKLYALRAVVAALQADKDAAAAVNNAVNALPETLTLDNKDAVYGAADAYAAMNDNAKAQVTVVDALNAAVAAMDKLVADDAAAKEITEAANALADDATKEEMKALVELYDAANAEVKALLTADVAAKCVAVKAEYVNMDAYEICFRSFDNQKADYNCNLGNVFYKKDIPAVGTGYMGGKVSGSATELHHYIYAYDQNHQDQADGTNKDGTVKYLVDDANDLYISFDFYVSDAAPINAVAGDCGFGIDASIGAEDSKEDIGTFQAWGSTFIARRDVVTPALKEVKTGWNHIVLPLSLQSKSAAAKMEGKEITFMTMRFYAVGLQLPDGFVTAVDDVRIMNGEAANKIFPARTNAKVVTDMIRAYPAEATADDFYAVYLAYNAVADEYKDLIIGWDAFVEANADKKAAAEEAMTADLAAATPVVEVIAALDKEIVYEDKAAIEAAAAALEALTDNQKVLVGNDNILALAQEALAELELIEKDKQAAQAVIDAINALPETVSDTDVSNTDIAAAREAYDALTDAQKAMIAEEIVAKLAAAEANLVIAIDMAAAAEVEAMINALPTPTDITVSDTDVVNAAAEAYGKLTAAQKEYLGEGVAEKLAACVAALDEALTIKMGDVNGDGNIDAKDALMVLKAAVDKVDLTDSQAKAADVNKDGKIDAKDALEILKHSVDKPSALDK